MRVLHSRGEEVNTLCKAAKHMLEVADANQYAVANQAPHGDVMAYNAAVNNLRTALKQEEEASAWLDERKEHWRKEREKAQATKDQDPELSAALGWPGGISDPVLDRTQLLQMVAALRLASQQALEVLKFCTPKPRPTDDDYAEQGWQEHNAAIAALRAALAQQAEPARGWVSMDEYKRLQGLVTSQGIRLMEYESKQPQQAEPVQEPVEPVAWVASKDGRVIYDDASKDDSLLRVSGDFENDAQRVRYAKRIVDKLNAASAQQAEPVQEPVATVVARQYDDGTYAGNALDWAGRNCEDDFPVGTKLYTDPPQRTMVPLTEGEIDALPWFGSPRQFARAVEKASWEKNHGQA